MRLAARRRKVSAVLPLVPLQLLPLAGYRLGHLALGDAELPHQVLAEHRLAAFGHGAEHELLAARHGELA